MSGPLTRMWSGWQRFWFEPQETSSLALFRIAFGLVAVAWTATLIPNLLAFFGPDGVLPEIPARAPGGWGILAVDNSRLLLLVVVFSATLGAAIAVTVGLKTRLAAVVLWIGILSFHQRNGLVMNAGDAMIRDLAFFCVLAPAGAALSLDRFFAARGHFWQFPARVPWALRLIQIQLSVAYLSAVWSKVRTEPWNDGTAVSWALRMQDYLRSSVPEFITHSLLLTNVVTFGTLAVELAIGVLVWNRTARPWVLALGVVMHLAIDSAFFVGFFSFAMLAAYVAFVPPETAARCILASRDLLARLRRRATRSRRISSGGPPDTPHAPSDTPRDDRPALVDTAIGEELDKTEHVESSLQEGSPPHGFGFKRTPVQGRPVAASRPVGEPI